MPDNNSFLATRRGKLTLILLCCVGFMDFVDASIVNVALPSIRRDLHFSVQGLQWVPSAYLLTYGGFMLLGGRAADLLGRRRVLVTGTLVIGIASLIGGFAGDSGVLIGARLAQGFGAALMLPAALSALTVSFREGTDRHTALGVWAAVAGLSSAAGVLFGGLLTQGPGWRWVMFVNPIACVLLLAPIFRLIPAERRAARDLAGFDFPGAILATGGMLLLVFALVKAPDQGWGSGRTTAELIGAGVILTVFVLNELRSRNPLLPMSVFRVRGLAAADLTQFIAFAGFVSMFFFVTLYMQNVLGYSPIKAGLAYLPLCFAIGFAATGAGQLLSRVGTRPLIIAGAVITAGGVYWLSRIPVHGSFLTDLLPGMLVMSAGIGAMFVAVATAANAGVRPDQAGLAAALLNSAQQVGGALGLAVLSAIATARTSHLLATRTPAPEALTSGFGRALLAGSIALAASAVIAFWVANTREQSEAAPPAPEPEPVAPGSGGTLPPF
ncbi:MAG: MFS transporter [Streptosporangiaceae bacterium]|nr:MFS transporter [Streptosporangiaceae bacterium]